MRDKQLEKMKKKEESLERKSQKSLKTLKKKEQQPILRNYSIALLNDRRKSKISVAPSSSINFQELRDRQAEDESVFNSDNRLDWRTIKSIYDDAIDRSGLSKNIRSRIDMMIHQDEV